MKIPSPPARDRLRQARLDAGWSKETTVLALKRLARQIGDPVPGVDRRLLGRWESGQVAPSSFYVRLLCLLFQRPPDELELAPLPAPLLLPADLHTLNLLDSSRREFIVRTLAASLGVPAIWLGLWERLADTARHPGLVDAGSLEDLARLTAWLEEQEPAVPKPAAMLGPAMGHLNTLTGMLGGSLLPSKRRQLQSLAGETALVIGFLLWNLNDEDRANQHLKTSVALARESGDQALGAYLIGCAVCWSHDPPQTKLRRLREGDFGFHPSQASPWTRVWLAGKEADACAAIGNDDGCRNALERAQRDADRHGFSAEGARPRWHRWGHDWLAGERGASLAKLGRQDGREALTAAIERVGPDRPKDRPWLLLALAQSFLRGRDIEPQEASRLIAQVVVEAPNISAPVLQEIRGVCEEVNQSAAGQVARDTAEQLRMALDRYTTAN